MINYYDDKWFDSNPFTCTIDKKLSSIEKEDNILLEDYWVFLNTNIWFPLILLPSIGIFPDIQEISIYRGMQAQRRWCEREIWKLKLHPHGNIKINPNDIAVDQLFMPNILYGVKVDYKLADIFIVQRILPLLSTILDKNTSY
jgi:hypothetical protein